MKKKNRKSKVILVLALILFITVGYAALTSTLNITGNSEIKNAKWDIHFANLVVDSNSVEAATPAAIDESKTTINYGVNLKKPGDSYSFTVDVVNEGTIDGMINVVSNEGLTAEQQRYVEYKATYTNGKELKEKDGLKTGAKKRIKVIVKYKDDINSEDLPKEEATINLAFKIDYVQADDTVTSPVAPIMKSYTSSSTDDYHNSKYKSKVTKIVTKTYIDVPATAIEQWDVSAAGDGSVIAYIEDDGSGNGTYSVTIGGNGEKIIANEDSSNLFYNFTSLNEIDLSNFDTSKVTNMQSMFNSCRILTSLDVSHFDTSNVGIMAFMFQNCSSLTSLNLSSFDTSKVTGMNAMFYSCSNLTSLDVSNFNTSNVTDMKDMFYGCRSLTSLNVSNFNTSRVTNMCGMFASCTGLTSLDLSNFDTSKVTNMIAMFSNCGSLINLDLSSFNTSNVTNMSQMFEGCSNLTSLNVSNFDTSKVTSMERMFYYCSKLITTITISNSATTSYSSVFSDAATAEGAKITVNYTTSAPSGLVDYMIATKSSNSNVVKGSLVS